MVSKRRSTLAKDSGRTTKSPLHTPSTPCHSDVEDDDCNSVDQSEVEAGVVGALLSLGDGGTVGLQEEMVGEEDEYGWAPQQSEM
jgi:hypothetical protein